MVTAACSTELLRSFDIEGSVVPSGLLRAVGWTVPTGVVFCTADVPRTDL